MIVTVVNATDLYPRPMRRHGVAVPHVARVAGSHRGTESTSNRATHVQRTADALWCPCCVPGIYSERSARHRSDR